MAATGEVSVSPYPAKARTAELFFDLGHQGCGGRGSADEEFVETAQVVLVQVGEVDHCGCHRGDHREGRDALAFDELTDFLGVEALDDDVPAARESDGVGTSPTVGVEQRNGVHLAHLVGGNSDRAPAAGQQRIDAVEVERAVREHHAFGASGAAAGVEEIGDGGFVVGSEVDRLGLGFGEELFVVARVYPVREAVGVGQRNPGQIRTLVVQGGAQVGELGVEQNDFRS